MWQAGSAWILAVVFFFAVCLSAPLSIRGATVAALIALAVVGICRFPTLRDRITPPLLVLTVFVVVCGASTFYAISGKFALQEFLKLLFSYCTALILLAAAPKDSLVGGRWIAAILTGGAALISLVSIDLLSTHIISTPVLSLLSLFSANYASLGIVEPGIRMLSLLDKPNIYAGVAAIGVLLGLSLASSESVCRKRCIFASLPSMHWALYWLSAWVPAPSSLWPLWFICCWNPQNGAEAF